MATGDLLWDQIRFSLLYQATTDANGFIWVPFSPAFPSSVHGVVPSLDDSGGTRDWCLGIKGPTASGFYAGIADQSGGPVVGVLLGIHYIAFGE